VSVDQVVANSVGLPVSRTPTNHTMTASPERTEFRFEVAISFAGPYRDKVRAIAERLSEAIDPGIEDRSKGRVFFDEWFRHEILGSDMDVLLQQFSRVDGRRRAVVSEGLVWT
jgi:hypothetical protein